MTTKQVKQAVFYILNRYDFETFKTDLSDVGIPTVSDDYVTEKWIKLQNSPIKFLLLDITGGDVILEKIIARADEYYS